MTCLAVSEGILRLFPQLALKILLRQDVCIFDVFNIEITQSVMPKPVFLMTAQEAHKEYNSLTDQIWAKYKQLDSGEYGAVGTPAFNAEDVSWLIYLLVWANFVRNWTCQLQRNYTGPHSSSIEDTFWI